MTGLSSRLPAVLFALLASGLTGTPGVMVAGSVIPPETTKEQRQAEIDAAVEIGEYWDQSRHHSNAAPDLSPRRLRRVAPGWKSAGTEAVVEHLDAGGGAIDVGVQRRLSEEGGEGIQEELARTRDYLNGLVSESASKTREQACNIAFVKTHKTASTTLAMIFVRYARRHDKKLASFGGNHVSAIPLEEAVEQIKRSDERVDVMHYHFTSFGIYKKSWREATAKYERIMRDDERINYISVIRDARSHFLSYFYFYVQPEVRLPIEHFYKKSGPWLERQRERLENPMCMEFGIRNENELDDFIAKELPKFRLVILLDQFDEGLMLLRRLMGWDMIDMTYSRMMETTGGTRRWDGKELKSVPHFDELSQATQEVIDKNTYLDRKLYDAAAALYNMRKEVAANEIAAELKEFYELQGVVNDYLYKNTSSEANLWYSGSVQPYLGGPPFYPFR